MMCMYAATELLGMLHMNNTNRGSVFFAKELFDVFLLLCFFIREFVGRNRSITADFFPYPFLYLAQLFFRDGFVVVEVKSKSVFFNKRSSLADMRTQDFLQSSMEKVGCCMVVCNLLPSFFIYDSCKRFSRDEDPTVHHAYVRNHPRVGRLAVFDKKMRLIMGERSTVSNL